MKGKKLITIISIVCILAVMLCVPAFATVSESDGNGYALYNGVKLPVLPEYDESKYTFSFVGKLQSTGEVYFVCCGELYRARTDGFVGWASPTYVYVLSGDEWDFASYDHYEGHYTADQYAPVIWVSRDVYDESDPTQLNYSYSNPIPLDSYNIIEWDGDTTGLTVVENEFYKLAPYEFAVYALAVWNGDSRSIQASYVDLSPIWLVESAGASGVADGIALAAGSNGSAIGPTSFDGIVAYKDGDNYTSLIAYRTTEAPPDEGGGDDPDDPQPPFGRLIYKSSNYKYNPLHG